MKVVEAVRSLIASTVEGLGYVLYDIEFQKEANGYVLTVFIDSEGGVTIDDCEKVSRAIDPLLDENDPIDKAYFLSVSSVGIDRPIKTDKDFERKIGVNVDVRLYAPVGGKKEFAGTLLAFDNDSFTISSGDGEHSFLRKSAALVREHIDF